MKTSWGLTIAIVAFAAGGCRNREFNTDSDVEALTASRKAMVNKLLVGNSKRSTKLPMLEGKEENAIKKAVSTEVEVELKIKTPGVKYGGYAKAKFELNYERYSAFIYRINTDIVTERDLLFKNINNQRNFNLNFLKSRDHVLYCEIGAKMKQIAGVSAGASAEIAVVTVSADVKLDSVKELSYAQYSGSFDLKQLENPNATALSWFSSVCDDYGELVAPVIDAEIKDIIAERLRQTAMLEPGKDACTVPQDTPEYRKQAGMTTASNYDAFRITHSDEDCEFILSSSRLFLGAQRIGRCISSSKTPYGHCERRTREGSPCNIFRKPDGSFSGSKDEGATRLTLVNHPDCDELAGLTCTPATASDIFGGCFPLEEHPLLTPMLVFAEKNKQSFTRVKSEL